LQRVPASYQREQLQALQARLGDVRDLVRDAIRQRDFGAMEVGFKVYRELLDEQKALVRGEPVPQPNAVHPREPALLGAWAYFSLCPSCRQTGTPQSWSATARQIRIEYSCRSCQRSWQVTGTEAVERGDLVPAQANTVGPGLAADAPLTQAPPDKVAAWAAVVAGIVLGGGVLIRLVPKAMNLLW
jgi:hypothetical protein